MGAYATSARLHTDSSGYGMWCNTTTHGPPVKRAAIEIQSAASFDAALSWRAQIVGCHVKGSTFHFDLEVMRPDGEYAFSVSRTLEEFQRAHNELKSGLQGHRLKDFPNINTLLELPATSMKPWMQESCAQLQQWLDEVAEERLLFQSSPLQNLFGLPNRSNLWAAPGTPSLMMIVECHQPLLLEIASYVAETAADLVHFCDETSRLVSRQISFAENALWAGVLAQRWPACHEALAFQGAQDWKQNYRHTLHGKREFILEIFDREKKLGFAMAAMAARVTYDKVMNGFVARYLSASEVLPEVIPAIEGHRLRFCPPSARAQLRPGLETASCHAEGRPPAYPYRVLVGHQELVVGQGVELQWKMQFGSPFGWWYGHLEALQRDPDGKLATATITFRHFPSTSRWYRLEVSFGDSEMRPCSFGGYTGGIRAASAAEHKHWMRYFPKEPVVF